MVGWLEVVQGRESVGADGQYDDEALDPVVGRGRGGLFEKVFVDVARPVEAHDAELFTLTESAQLAGITTTAQADDGEFGDGEVARVEGSETRTNGWSAVFDGELIERWEAVDELVERIWEDHAVEGEIAEVGEGGCVGVHGLCEAFGTEEVYWVGNADLVEDAGFMGAIGSVEEGDFAVELHDRPCAADLLDAVDLRSHGGYAEREGADDGAEVLVLLEKGGVPDEAEGV